jgi:hypothetical protein
MVAQRGDSDYGKVLRFNDDGSVPRHPFADRNDVAKEIFKVGAPVSDKCTLPEVEDPVHRVARTRNEPGGD